MKNYLKEAGNIHLSYYLEAADALDIKYEIIVKGLIGRFEYKDKHWFIIRTVPPIVNSPGKAITSKKHLANLVLEKAGLPIPKIKTLNNVQDALDFFTQEKKIVIKPTTGLGGSGVVVLPTSQDEVKTSFKHAQKNSKAKKEPKVIGEKYIEGENYRFLTLSQKVIGIVKRHKPYILGNGTSTIKELISTTNPKIPLDFETEKNLKNQNLTFQSIPKLGQKIVARNNTNLTTGGKTEEYSKHVHPYYKKLAIQAIDAVGLKLGGVDIIAKDITKPDECVINEINYNPGLRIHYQVNKGKKIKVAIPIMQYIRDNEI